MRHASNFPQPTRAERALIKRRVKTLCKKYGNCHRAALRLGINPKYMYSIHRGERSNPGDVILRKLGLRRISYIEEVNPTPLSAGR